MKRAVLVLVLAGCFQAAWASSYDDYAKELGGLGKGASADMMRPEEFTPRYDPNPPMSDQYYGGGIALPIQYGEDKINRCNTEKAHTDLYLRQECEGVNFIANNKTKKPDVTLTSNEKLVQGTQTIASDPATTLEKYKWTYPVNADGSIGSVPESACPTETVDVPAVVKEKTCSQFSGMESKLCEATLNVTVDPNWNYSCRENPYVKEGRECKKTLTVVCEAPPDCTLAGIVPDSNEGDMEIKTDTVGNGVYTYSFGVARTHTWGSRQAADGTYDRTLKFDIKNAKNIQLLKLSKVDWDDFTVIKVNGTVVWSTSAIRGWGKFAGRHVDAEWGPKPYVAGFGFARKRRHAVTPDTKETIGWIHQNKREVVHPDIDLRPHVRDGRNIIEVRTMVIDGGNVQIGITASSYCDPVCHDQWQNGCLEYEKKVTE